MGKTRRKRRFFYNYRAEEMAPKEKEKMVSWH